MSKDTGGPAFPSLNAVCTGLDSDGGERWDTEPSGGMTLRDYFAAKAQEGDILAQAEVLRTYSAIGLLPDGWRAKARYMHADAMLAERAK